MNAGNPMAIRAALLTGLAPAGITVIQVVGPGAVDLVAQLLRDGKGGLCWGHWIYS